MFWNLQVDNIPDFVFLKAAFSKQECKDILDYGKSLPMIESSISGTKDKKNQVSEDVRKSRNSWIDSNTNSAFIFSKLANLVHTVNTEFFKFNLYGFGEPLQFTEYTAPGGHYAYHVDREYNSMIRKLSVSVQLSNPKKYSGGKLIINGSELPADAYEQGSVVMFPSFINHTVLPVSEGKRYALVAWITGDNFK